MKRGLYIVIDGLDGSGKGGVLQALELKYPHIKASEENPQAPVRPMYTREPGGTELGEQIRQLLLNWDMDPVTEFFLFLAQRKETRNMVERRLAEGVTVISDRSDSSTFAFQIYGRLLYEVEPLFLESLKLFAPKPDLYIILDLPAEIAKERTEKRKQDGGNSDRIDNEGISFHRRVREGFLKFEQRSDTPFVFIDATRTPEEVAADVVSEVGRLFGERLL